MYPNDIFYQQTFGAYRRIGSNLRYVPVKNYTISSLFYNGTTGSFRPGQTGRIIHDVGLDVNGFYQEKKVIYFGDIRIYKTYIRDLAWNLFGLDAEQGIMPDPHYFAVEKPGDWSNQTYKVNGGIAFPLFRDKLGLSVEADYQLSNKFRTDFDPLVKVSNDALTLKVLLNYRTGGHIIHAGGHYGYAHMNNDTDYANDPAHVPSNHASYSRWMAGYGTLINSLLDNTEGQGTEHTFQAGYTNIATLGRRIIADISFTQGRIDKHNSTLGTPPDSDDDDTFAKYYTSTTEGNLFYSKKLSDQRSLLANFKGKTFSGHNYLSSKGGKTYRASLTDATLDVSTVRRAGRMVRYEAGASVRYTSSSQEDALAMTAVDFSSVATSVFVLKDFALGDHVIFTPYVKAGYKRNLSASLVNGNAAYLASVPATDYTGLAARNFYEHVVYHDYNIFSQHTVTGSASAAFRFMNTGKFRTTLKLTEDAEASLGSGGARWVSQFALILDY